MLRSRTVEETGRDSRGRSLDLSGAIPSGHHAHSGLEGLAALAHELRCVQFRAPQSTAHYRRLQRIAIHGPQMLGPSGLVRLLLADGLVKQPTSRNLQRLGNLLQHNDSGIANATLDAADIGAVQAAFEGKPLLAQPPVLAEILDVEAHPPAHIHGASGALMYTTDLQTMSLILLDFLRPARDQLSVTFGEKVAMEITPSIPPTPPVEPAHSSAREKVLEHLFVGELLRCLWRRGIRNMEVLRAEVDMGGYDLVLEANKVLRYVQLKSSHRTSATANVPVNINLEGKPGGCVVWMKFDPETVELGPYLWFGAKPGEPTLSLGSKIARHSKGDKNGVKAFRPNIRVLPIGRFQRLASIDDVADALFGGLSTAHKA